jgi:hypothetical protein
LPDVLLVATVRVPRVGRDVGGTARSELGLAVERGLGLGLVRAIGLGRAPVLAVGLGRAPVLAVELASGLVLELGLAAAWLPPCFGVVAASELPPDRSTVFTSTTVSTSASPMVVRRRQ